MHTLRMKFLCSILSVMIGIVPGWHMLASAANTTATVSYSLDVKSRLITIHPKGDVSAQINSALSYLVNRPDKNIPWSLKFEGGNYYLSKGLVAEKLENVSLISDRSKPAILIKKPDFASEYLFYTRFSKNVSLRGFDFHGLTKGYNPASYVADPSASVWRDQGLYFGSSNGITVNMSRFFNFGNAAIRVTTTERDPVHGVNSFNTLITQNYFNNVFQISTTSNDIIHGGSSNFLFQGNTFDNLRGSIKFATRTPGAHSVYIRHNSIRNSSTDGIEIVGYTKLEVSNNQFQNIARNAVNCYSNERAAKGFAWGDELTFKNNVINNTGGGIRISADTFPDGYQPAPKNVSITSNTISNLTGNAPAITLLKGPFNGLKVTDNQFNNIPSKKYIYLQQQSSDSTISGNKVENKLLTASN